MKFVCSQTELNSALQLVSRAVPARPTHPVLGNVLLTADQSTNRLSLTGFDLNLGIQTSFKASIENSGAITIPARIFFEIVSKLSTESPITLSVNEEDQTIDLTSLSSSFQMRGMPSDDFPDLPLVQSGNSLKINIGYLVKSLKSTLFACSNDEAKQLLTGVHLSFNSESMETAATDGHRLAVLNIKDANKETEDLDFSVTLPSRSLREIERLISSWDKDKSVTLFYDQGQVVFLSEDQILTSRTLEGVYPNYKELIPLEFSKIIEIDRKSFISSLERVGVLADQHNNIVRISASASQLLDITADAQDVGKGFESIPIVYSGESLEIAFNVKYVLEGLKAIDSDKIFLKCNTPTTPAVLSTTESDIGLTYLVMPVQIRT